MEGLTKHFNVNFILSEEVLQKMETPDRFQLRYLGKVQAKGKMQSLGVYECFDSDPEDQVILKKNTRAAFNAGIEAYYNKDMINARRHFDTVYQTNPADLTAFGFLHKIHGYVLQGVPDGWTGVEVMEYK